MCRCEQSIPPAFNVGHTKKAPLFLGECRGEVHSSHCTIKYSSYLILLAAKVSLMSPASPLLSAWYKSPVVHCDCWEAELFPKTGFLSQPSALQKWQQKFWAESKRGLYGLLASTTTVVHHHHSCPHHKPQSGPCSLTTNCSLSSCLQLCKLCCISQLAFMIDSILDHLPPATTTWCRATTGLRCHSGDPNGV